MTSIWTRSRIILQPVSIHTIFASAIFTFLPIWFLPIWFLNDELVITAVSRLHVINGCGVPSKQNRCALALKTQLLFFIGGVFVFLFPLLPSHCADFRYIAIHLYVCSSNIHSLYIATYITRLIHTLLYVMTIHTLPKTY